MQLENARRISSELYNVQGSFKENVSKKGIQTDEISETHNVYMEGWIEKKNLINKLVKTDRTEWVR